MDNDCRHTCDNSVAKHYITTRCHDVDDGWLTLIIQIDGLYGRPVSLAIVHWFVGWMVGWLIGLLVGFLAEQLVVWGEGD